MALARMPLRFEANHGQFPAEVLYMARASGLTLALTARGPAIRAAGAEPVNLSFVNANRLPHIEALDQFPARTDYFVGKRESWRTGISSYARVRYGDVYPGIDAVYYGNQSQLEYDFVLRPGADPNAIRLKFRGPVQVSISPEGDLILDSPAGRLVQKKPVVYQQDGGATRREIAGRYVMLSRDTAGFRVGRSDRGRSLVIDPALIFSSYLGGTGKDQINAAKLGPHGWLYITGQTDTLPITPTDGAVNAGSAGLLDAFLAIVDTTPGAGYPLIYYSNVGGSANDAALAIDVDAAGLAYLTGYTASTDFPVTGNAFQAEGAASTQDAFVIVLNPCIASRNSCSVFGGDSVVFSSYLGGASGSDVGNGIALDRNGLIYIIGNTRASDFVLTDNAYTNVLWGSQDIFIAKIDPTSGALLYASYVGGETGQDDGRAILVGSNGLVYFAGSTASQNFPVVGLNFNPNPSGGQDLVIGVMDLAKSGPDSLVYSTYLGGTGNEEVRAMAFDANGDLLLTGYTLSTDFPTTNDAIRTINSGANDAFVVVFNPALPSRTGLLYSTYLGGSHGDSGWAIQGDASGFIYVTGYTLSGDFPIVNAIQPEWGNGIDLFITKLKPGVAGPGAIQFSTYFGASAIYQPTGILLAPDGTAIVVGYGYAGLPIADTAFQTSYSGGGADGFLLVLSQ